MKIRPWELWWAEVKFEGSDDSKVRPVIVVGKNVVAIFSLKVTSHEPRNKFYGEYELIYWKKAGLEKPSTVRISKFLKLKESDFISKIGDLEAADIKNIKTLKNNQLY